MKKIIVIGCPGSGKSTLSIELHKKTNIPLFHLDMMYWNEKREVVEKSLFLNHLKETLKRDEWIIDGNYLYTMEQRMAECDTVIFLDFPTEVCLDGVRQRRGKPRADMPWIENENEEDAEFINFIKEFNEMSRPKIIALLNKYSNKNIHIFKSRKEADEFLMKM